MYKVYGSNMCDFYKTPISHAEQYNKNITQLVSYYTPRMSRIKEDDKVIMFGLQYFIKDFLIDYFNENFFQVPLDEIVEDYNYTISETLSEHYVDATRIIELHNLGYLPIRIDAIAEGERVDMKTPMFMVTNTHDRFAWVVNFLESVMSASVWYPMLIANVGYKYRKIIEQYYDETVEAPQEKYRTAISEFGFRGGETKEGGTIASMAMLVSLAKTATIPAIKTLHHFYNDAEKSIRLREFGSSMLSTEHSTATSSFSIDGDEETFIRKVIFELYPIGNVSFVSDSYDYWNVINNILPTMKDEIMGRNGCCFWRGDSGDPIEIVTQTVFRLWDIFGGTTNNKGYKVLDSHVRALYGDSITNNRAKKIYQILKDNGFSSENVALGAGSFSLRCLEGEDGTLYPFTRDTFSAAIKTVSGVYDDGFKKYEFPIFKDPITDSGHFKKSQKGCCLVSKDENGDFTYIDELTFDEAHNSGKNEMITVFENGKLVKNYSIRDIRNKLWDGKF